MRYSIIAPLALAAGASATGHNVTYTTEVVTSYETYCPGPTAITHGGKTYTVTEATTLTITDCPCTVTKPAVPTLPPAVETHVSVPAVETHVSVPAVETHVSVPAVETHVSSVPAVETHVSVPAVETHVYTPPAETPIYSVPVVAPPAPTASAPSVAPVSPTTPSAPIFTGAGTKAAASGMGLAGLAAVAAFFL